MDTLEARTQQTSVLNMMIYFSGRMDWNPDDSSSEAVGLDALDFESFIQELNGGTIKHGIENRFSRIISDSRTRFDAQIHFSEGSVVWDGVLSGMNWMACVGGAIGLIEYLKKITITIVNTEIKNYIVAIKRKIPDSLRHARAETTAHVDYDLINRADTPLSNSAPRHLALDFNPTSTHEMMEGYMALRERTEYLENELRNYLAIDPRFFDKKGEKPSRSLVAITVINSALLGFLILMAILYFFAKLKFG